MTTNIDYNTRKRAQSKNSFEKDYYKLENKTLFGKPMEDVRKRIDYKLITYASLMENIFHSPRLHSSNIIIQNFTGFKMFKFKVTNCKAVFIG